MAGVTNGANGNGGPWWAKLALQLGTVSVIALFLVWFLADTVLDRLDRQEALLWQICANTAEHGQCFVGARGTD